MNRQAINFATACIRAGNNTDEAIEEASRYGRERQRSGEWSCHETNALIREVRALMDFAAAILERKGTL